MKEAAVVCPICGDLVPLELVENKDDLQVYKAVSHSHTYSDENRPADGSW